LPALHTPLPDPLQLLSTAGIACSVYSVEAGRMLLTLQQGWRGIELRDFLASQACVQQVEWDAVRYPGAGSPIPRPESAGAASPAGAVKRAGRGRGTADADRASRTGAQRRATGDKSSKPRQKGGSARGKRPAKREASVDATPPAAVPTSTDETRTGPSGAGSVQRQADEAIDSPSNQRIEL